MTIITGAIKFTDVPNDFCLTNIVDLIKFIESKGKLELDAASLTNVSVGVDQPVDTSVVWFQISNSGNLIAVKVYVNSQWLPVFPPPSSTYRMYGNSNNIPLGYALITDSTPGFSSGMVAHLESQWLRDSTDSFWEIFDVVYTGL